MNKGQTVLLLAIAGGISVGALGMAVLGESAPTELARPAGQAVVATSIDAKGNVGDTDPLVDVVESLVAMIDQEIAERQVLAEEIRSLRGDVERLEQALSAGDVAVASSARISGAVRRQRQQPTSRADRLQAAGFSERDVAAIERRTAEAAMQQMSLDDRARREGWVNTPRYFEEFQALQSGADSVRGYLGDEAYDRYLFATGRPNRLSVQSVIATSPAEQAGLQPGDLIVSYADQRVFSTQQLVELRSGGQQGQSVSMEVLRDGATVEITMPRGPIGIQTGPFVADPSAIDVPTE